MTGHLHMEICFGPNGRTDFYPQKGASRRDREELALRLRRLVEIFYKNPEGIR